MKTLFNLDIQDYNPNWIHSSRPSARAIILPEIDFSSIDFENPHFSPETKVALVYSKKCDYYNFPGGGVHNDEKDENALCREVSEETALVVDENKIVEYGKILRLEKSNLAENTIFEQESRYYFCGIKRNSDGSFQKTKQNLDGYELDEGYELRIVTFQQAIDGNRKSIQKTDFYTTMVARETNVLEILIGQTPEPTIEFSKLLLKLAAKQNPGPWEKHSLAVGECAKKIAIACQQNGYFNINPEKAFIYGTLHDIGRKMGYTYIAHVYDGYKYFLNFGYKNVAKICLTHSFNTYNFDDYIGKIDIDDEKLNELKILLQNTTFDDYDILIQMLDATVGSFDFIDMEERMNDVEKRYGKYPEQKRQKNRENRKYFEKLMNKDLYDVLKSEGDFV